MDQTHKTINIEDKNADIAGINDAKTNTKTVIYTMPKKFAVSGTKSENARQVGILILAGGLFILIGAFGALYYFFFMSKGGDEAIEAAIQKTGVEQPSTKAVNTEPAAADTAAVADSTIGQGATSSPVSDLGLENSASASAALIATATEIIDQGISAGNSAATSTNSAVQTNTPLAYGSDQDKDGLSDLEEAILGTNPALANSDGDQYGDMAEITSLYNPAGSGKLIVNPNIEKYANSKYGYSLYYPKSWTINSAIGDDSIIFQIDGIQFVQIVYEANAEKLDIETWYKKQFSIESIGLEQKVYKKNWTGVKNADGMTYYLAQAGSEKIFVISYSLGTTNTVNFKSIFEMMVNSFEAN